MKYKLELYDKDGYFKVSVVFTSRLFAYREGQNWEMLTKGNSYKLTEESK